MAMVGLDLDPKRWLEDTVDEYSNASFVDDGFSGSTVNGLGVLLSFSALLDKFHAIPRNRNARIFKAIECSEQMRRLAFHRAMAGRIHGVEITENFLMKFEPPTLWTDSQLANLWAITWSKSCLKNSI